MANTDVDTNRLSISAEILAFIVLSLKKIYGFLCSGF